MNIKTLMRMSSYFLSTLPKTRPSAPNGAGKINVFDIKAKKKFETISFQTSFSYFVTPIGFKPITF